MTDVLLHFVYDNVSAGNDPIDNKHVDDDDYDHNILRTPTGLGCFPAANTSIVAYLSHVLPSFTAGVPTSRCGHALATVIGAPVIGAPVTGAAPVP